jgi:HlyD family secretion protein
MLSEHRPRVGDFIDSDVLARLMPAVDTGNAASRELRSIRRHLVAGVAATMLLGGGVGVWAATTEISGALIAPGQLVVDSDVKKVQHPTGGVVGEIRVRDGDRVSAGDVVIRLDETVTRANLSIVLKSLDELNARQARLEAERDGDETIDFPAELATRASDRDVARIIKGETKLFELRRTSRAGQTAQLQERIAQLREEILGLVGQITAKEREGELIAKELEGVRLLWQKNLVPIQRVTALERDATRIDGERGQLIAASAQTKGKISETELQIIQVDQDLRSEVAKELREFQGKIAELVERKVTAEDQLRRIDIRAPQDGVVHQLGIHTLGGVISPGETIMLIVPDADSLTVETKVNPQDIDQVKLGQKAVLRFSAFNQRTTPELDGVVVRVSADTSVETRTGQSFYTVRIATPPQEVARLGLVKLLPGMPVEAFVQTGQRTVTSYLMKPLLDQLNRAFKEK